VDLAGHDLGNILHPNTDIKPARGRAMDAPGQDRGGEMTGTTESTTVRQAREAVVRAHVDAENRHDPEATVATFSASTARYDIPAMGADGDVPDHEAIRTLFEGLFTVFPDFHAEPGPLRHGDDHVLVEVLLTGTQHADWAGIPNTGRSFATRLAAVFDFEGDQLVCERVYMDFGDIARQLTAPESDRAGGGTSAG
jgi:steroid delta-isomerase-like uncharacterized protein